MSLDDLLSEVFEAPPKRTYHYRVTDLKGGELRAVELPGGAADEIERIFRRLPDRLEDK